MFEDCLKKCREWRKNAVADPDLSAELDKMLPDAFCTESANVLPGEEAAFSASRAADLISEAFGEELSFGTAGLRGVIGAGTSRMNVYTVARATQGLSDYICAHYAPEDRTAAVSYDSRIKSDLFARTAAEIFAANGIRCRIYRRLMPVPCLSFAVRRLGCAGGVMITASHNPSKYNGYKVFGNDGCQITEEAAAEISEMISRHDCFSGISSLPFEEGLASGLISYIDDSVFDDYIAAVKKESLLSGDPNVDREIPIVYSPLNGTGYLPVTRILSECGFRNITPVEEQKDPDGRFPTCPFPNPEIREALSLGIELAKKCRAELMLATDPDADRVGIAVRCGDDYRLFTGNEVGILLTDWICARRKASGRMPKAPLIIKTVVSSYLADEIAASYGVKTVNVLTGFKYIGEQIGLLEKEGRADSFLLGFEESYGYLSGSYVRDKDAVVASMLICEMYADYRSRGKTLAGRLEEIWSEYGYSLDTQHSFYFEGTGGKERMNRLLDGIRAGVASFAGLRVEKVTDFLPGLGTLPPSNVLKLNLEGGCSVIVRPSGTEPKIKFYLSVRASSAEEAKKLEKRLADAVGEYVK